MWVLAACLPALADQARVQPLFSEHDARRLVRDVVIPQERLEALHRWQQEIRAIMALPVHKRPGELDLQERFFTELFVKALGYERGYERDGAGPAPRTLESEYPTSVDRTRPDGVLGFLNGERDTLQRDDIQAVIELKAPGVSLDLRQSRSRDRRSPVDQAFSYAHKFEGVKWVLVSNYTELRLYQSHSSGAVLTFDLTRLADDREQATLFWRVLSRENLIRQKGPSRTSRWLADREREVQQITDRFYEDYKAVRLATARAILSTSDPDVDRAVTLTQILLNRMIFIAFLEDLGLIPQGTIEAAWQTRNPFTRTPVWDTFKALFVALDQGREDLGIPAYGGLSQISLFRTNPDIQALDLPDSLLKQYRTLAAYDFRWDLRVTILGHVFEQSVTDLTHLKEDLRGTPRRDTPQPDTRRHDEGAWYTPAPVAAYIVEHTLGPYLEQIRLDLGEEDLPALTQEDLSDPQSRNRARHILFWQTYAARLKTLRIVDPSCGSGAFLVAAFDRLVQEGNRINEALRALNAPRIFLWFDREILRTILHGVDLTPEAVAITRLSLWLRIARNRQPLVALDHTIRQGNAVTDVNWRSAFPHIMAKGGFDLVIGNPPYIRHERIRDLKPVLKERFETYTGRADLFVPFYELGYDLLKPGGMLGYISSNKWLRAGYGKKLRAFLRDKTTLTRLLDLGETDLFKGATTYTSILTFLKQTPPPHHEIIMADPPFMTRRQTMKQARLEESGYHLEGNPLFWSILEKMGQVGTPLAHWDIEINSGIKTGFNDAFIIDGTTRDTLIRQDPKSAPLLKPVLRGRDLKKWHVDFSDQWLIHLPAGWTEENRGHQKPEPWFKATYPALYRHFRTTGARQDTTRGKGRGKGLYERDDQGDTWWELRPCASCGDFEKQKIIYPEIAREAQFSLDREGYLHEATSYDILQGRLATQTQDLSYLTALLNSDLSSWYIRQAGTDLRGGYLRFQKGFLETLPVPQIPPARQKPFRDLSQDLHRLARERRNTVRTFLSLLQAEFGLTTLTRRLETWHRLEDYGAFLKALKAVHVTLRGTDKEDWMERFNRLKEHVENHDRQITALEEHLNIQVYRLYGLREEEIRFIEKGG